MGNTFFCEVCQILKAAAVDQASKVLWKTTYKSSYAPEELKCALLTLEKRMGPQFDEISAIPYLETTAENASHFTSYCCTLRPNILSQRATALLSMEFPLKSLGTNIFVMHTKYLYNISIIHSPNLIFDVFVLVFKSFVKSEADSHATITFQIFWHVYGVLVFFT